MVKEHSVPSLQLKVAVSDRSGTKIWLATHSPGSISKADGPKFLELIVDEMSSPLNL